MTIAVHIVNTPKRDAPEAYARAWQVMTARGIKDPVGRHSHTAWMTGDVLHVFDVWESQDHMAAFMEHLGPIMEQHGMELAGPPEVGEVLGQRLAPIPMPVTG
jgi:hypothetical protein